MASTSKVLNNNCLQLIVTIIIVVACLWLLITGYMRGGFGMVSRWSFPSSIYISAQPSVDNPASFPYSFSLLNTGEVLINNKVSGEQKSINIKICSDSSVAGIDFKRGNNNKVGFIYSVQRKDWSAGCSGTFRKRIKLDF